MMSFIKTRWYEYNFLFEELVKRDFKKRYKRAALGILWSLVGPLLQLIVMFMVFTHFFGMDTPHFIIYVFSGQLIFGFFSSSTTAGMSALMANAGIISKTNAPKYIFLFSANVSNLINFALTLIIFFLIAAVDGIAFHPRFLLLIYPIISLLFFNIGVGLVLSALYVFFRDTQYLYGILTMLIMWMSAIFYPIEQFSLTTQRLFLLNPVFTHIHYFRLIVLHGVVPSATIHALCALYAMSALAVGGFIYKKFNYRFIYYM